MGTLPRLTMNTSILAPLALLLVASVLSVSSVPAYHRYNSVDTVVPETQFVVPDADPKDAGKPTELKGGEEKALADAGQAVEGTKANKEGSGDGEPKSQNREDIDKAVEKIGQDVKVASQMEDHEAAHKQSTRILDVSKAVKESAQAVASGPK